MRKGNEPFGQRAKHLESKAKLITHTNFMIAPKISKKGSCSWFLFFGIAIHRVKSKKKICK